MYLLINMILDPNSELTQINFCIKKLRTIQH